MTDVTPFVQKVDFCVDLSLSRAYQSLMTGRFTMIFIWWKKHKILRITKKICLFRATKR